MKYQNNKKHPVVFLIAALLACQPITAQAVTFADINQAPWPGAEVSINKAADLGLVVGETKNGKSYFKPKDPVSLAESCQFAYKVMVQTGKASANAAVTEKWTTVMNTYKIQSWAHTAVAYCLENSIISISDLSGFVSGEVNRSATREQAAEILGRALEVGVPSLRASATATKFVDNASIAADARPYIALLNSQKIVNGDDLNKFNPKNTLNRTETAVMVTNLYSVLKNTASTPAVSQPTSQSGKVASITNFYVNLESSSSYYLFSSSGITVTLNDESSSVSELVNLFKNEGAIEAKLTLDGSSRVTKIEATSGDVEEEKATEGKLTSVTYDDDDNDGSITIASKHTYKIEDADNIVIEIDEEDDYELDDLDELFDECKANDEYIEVKLTLDKDGDIKKIVGTIKSEGDEVKGVITDVEYDEEDDEGYIEIDDDDEYEFDDETSIKIDGDSSDWDDLIDLYDDYYSDDKDLRATLTLDGDYVETIVINTSSNSTSSTKGEITDMDNKSDDKGAIQLKDSKKYTIQDVEELEIEVIDGDEEIDNWDDLYTAQIDDNKTIEVELEFDDGVLVGIKGEVVWVKGLLTDYGDDYLTIEGKESGANVDYEFDDDESDMKKISVKNVKSGVSNMKELMDYFKEEVEEDSSYDVEDEEWTLKLTLKDGYITKVEKG